ncbi:hypothetical protein E4U28_003132 [Claviceps purpurea]|nr:hypothetical protein E4U28_003132 [Claviceps purpurea]
MDSQHWNQTIEDNPIANHLVGFHSHAGRKGVSNSADVDGLNAKDVSSLVTNLLYCLEIHPVAQGSLCDDLPKVIDAIGEDMVEDDRLRSLLKAAIIHQADDKTLWDVVLAFITATLTATHTATTASPGTTAHKRSASPIVHTTAGMVNTAEFHRYFDDLLEQELENKLHLASAGFLESFFPSRTYQSVAERFHARCMAGEEPAFNVETHSYESWPNPADEERVVAWLEDFITRLEEFSRPDFPTDISNQRAVLGLPHTYIEGHVAKRKLDACFVSAADQETAMGTLTYFWSQVLGAAELKENIVDEKTAELALGQYSRISLTAQVTRRYVLGFTLCGPLMRVWLFDRQGGIASERININKDPLQFIKVILGFLWMSKEDLGFDPTIKGPDFTLDGPDISDEMKQYIEIKKQDGEDKHIVLDEVISKISCVVGRATTCWKAHVKGHPEEILVVKDTWQNKTRPSEGDMLLLAESGEVVNVARHYHHETVQIRGMDDDILTCVRRGLTVTAWDHAQHGTNGSRTPSRTLLQELRNRETTSTNETGSGLHPQKRVCYSRPTDDAIEPPTELPNRVHRRVIVRDYGKAIYKASSRVALLACIEDCIKGHQSLYKAGILHRDISINNLMIREETATDQTEKGFLIDLDLAIQSNRPDTESDATERSQRTRTATRASTAIGVIEGEEHTFLHDLESFFWVLLWICIHYGKSGNESRVMPKYEKWHYVDNDDLNCRKKNTLTRHADFKNAANDFMPYYKPLEPWINELRELLPQVVQVSGMVFCEGKLPKSPGDDLYLKMIKTLQKAQQDPVVLAD